MTSSRTVSARGIASRETRTFATPAPRDLKAPSVFGFASFRAFSVRFVTGCNDNCDTRDQPSFRGRARCTVTDSTEPELPDGVLDYREYFFELDGQQASASPWTT